MLKTKISPSVVFIPEEDPPVFFSLPTFLTRVTRPTLKESLRREISGSSEAQLRISVNVPTRSGLSRPLAHEMVLLG